MNKLYNFIEKIGKHNLILISFIVIVLLITGIYQTFSLYTESGGISLIDGIKTLKFILGADVENSVTIASGSSKNIALTVSNDDKIKLKYGIYYSSSDDLTDVELGYKWDTEYLPNGSIASNEDYVVTIQIDNNSDSNVTINFGIKYGLETGGDLVLEAGEHWLDQKWNFSLSEVDAGSYVRYIGNNGCSGMSCSGQNANYVDDNNMGNCISNWATNNNLTFNFNRNGWRIAYINNEQVSLISGGAPECLATDSSGNMSSTYVSTYDTTNELPLHSANLSNAAKKYCNVGFVNGGSCDKTNVNVINVNDFKEITGSILSFNSCFLQLNSTACGYNNDLIDNGSYYWYYITNGGILSLYWDPNRPVVSSVYSNEALGVRPVIKLDDSVVVTSGSGTYSDPYIIDNRDTIKDLSGNMNNGAVIGDSWDRESGVVTTSADDSSYVDCGLAGYELGDAVSMVIRVKFNGINANQENDLFGNWESGGGGLLLSPLGKLMYGFYMSDYSSYKYYVTDFSPEVDVWYTIVGVYDGANLSLYLNGTLLEWDSDSSEYAGNNMSVVSGMIKTSAASILLGANPSSDGGYENGYFSNASYSDALLFARGLSASEIASDYSGEINSNNQEGLLLHYDFKR